MSLPVFIHNVRLVRPGESVAFGTVQIQDGTIEVLNGPEPADAVRIDGKGGLLTPGLMDLHTHGVNKFLYERSPEDIVNAAEILPQYGTTTVLPTLYKVLDRGSFEHLSRLADALESVRKVRFPGFHLEGPFLALPGAGADCVPGDLALLEDLLAACRGKVLAMSVSPDTPNILPVIERLVEKRIVPLITHTCATVEQTCQAIDAGAIHATHFYDVFPLPPGGTPGVRPCGTVETLLADPRCSVDFIADGVHVHPMAIRCALAAKGFRKVICITDSNIGAGLPEGIIDTPWGFPIHVKEGDGARIHDPGQPRHGGLAGSALTLDAGMRNLHGWLDLPSEQIWSMSTLNVATLFGMDKLGRMEPGACADLVLWDDELAVQKTWTDGLITFDRTQQN